MTSVATTSHGTFKRHDDGAVEFIPPLVPASSYHWTADSWDAIGDILGRRRADASMATAGTGPHYGTGAIDP